MTRYKHTQIGTFMAVITVAVFILFAWLQTTARAEPPSYDSGSNFAVTAIMALVLFTLVSFVTLTTMIDEQTVRIHFGWGIFRKTFSLAEIATVTHVKNPWYYGWGIRLGLRPTMWIFNVSGFDAVELVMKNGKRYRIGTDEPEKLETAIKKAVQPHLKASLI